MSEQKEDLKEYAGGWLTERKHAPTPLFLKLAFPVIGLCSTAYIVLQMYGDVSHETRGKFVQQFVKATQTSPALQYTVATLALIYVLIMIVFTYSTFKED